MEDTFQLPWLCVIGRPGPAAALHPVIGCLHDQDCTIYCPSTFLKDSAIELPAYAGHDLD